MNNKSKENNTGSETKYRWSSLGNYRLIIWVWMMNEVAVMFSPTEISHNGYYFHALIQTLSVIFIGIPLVYSEICVAQYTNCDVFTMWSYFPLLKYVGFGTIFLITLKIVYLMVLTSWYMQYAFYATMDPPPWFTCEGFNEPKCMVKSVNVSTFQHCIEAQMLFDDDCGMKTASNCFFHREIGDNNTNNARFCFFQKNVSISCTSLSLLLFILSLRNVKFLQIYVKILAFYVAIVILVLFCVALSMSGTWYGSSIVLHWSNVEFGNSFNSINRGVLSMGTGCGIIIFLSRDAPFRSPANMTAISTSLFCNFVVLMLALIAFSGIKTMSFYHGEEENVIEISSSMFFSEFASISEILSYFDFMPIWEFAWFSTISLCLFANLWILHIYLSDLMFSFQITRTFKKISSALLSLAIFIISWPFFCADLTRVLTDATELIQIINNILFSLSFYWIYGYQNHTIDIVFMIGVKSTYFWKATWLLNPVILSAVLYFRWKDVEIRANGESLKIELLSLTADWLLFYILVGIYFLILLFAIVFQLSNYIYHGRFQKVFSPSRTWGPNDLILYKSRQIFVPEIMTTEFLYRQVRIGGYYGNKLRHNNKMNKKSQDRESSTEDNIEWSAFTSN